MTVQRAIDFLRGPDAARLLEPPLPPRIDYSALAERAAENGHDLAPDDIRHAFRLLMRARRLSASAARR